MDMKETMNGKNITQFHHASVASLTMVITWTANDQVYTTNRVKFRRILTVNIK